MSFDLKISEGDLSINNTGSFTIVENSDKLEQDILKIISTKLGANPFHPWYGSPIESSMIGNVFDESFVSSVASSQLRTTLERLQQMQREQIKQAQIISPQEHIAAVQNVSVEQNKVDPRFYRIAVTVISKAFQRVQPSLDLRL